MHWQSNGIGIVVSDTTNKVSGKIVTQFLRAFYRALQAAHARYSVKYPSSVRELGAFVNHSLSSPGYFDKWFSDYPELRFSDQIVSKLVFDRAIKNKLFIDSEVLDLVPIHKEYIRYLDYIDGHPNITAANVDKQHLIALNKMLEASSIFRISKILDYEDLLAFIDRNVENYVRIGQISTATRNCKIIVSKLVGPDDLRSTAIESGDRTNWAASYAALKGALAAAQAEDHKALAFFERSVRKLRVGPNDDGFIAAAHEMISYLSRKYMLDFLEDNYPKIGPAMKSYLILESNPRSFYDIPADIRASILKGVSVEFRHQGAFAMTKAPTESVNTLDAIHKTGLSLAIKSKNSELEVQMMLSKAWTHFKENELEKAEEIACICREITKKFDDRSIIQAEVGELTGYLSLRMSAPRSSHSESSKELLQNTARRFREIGSMSRSESIIARIKKEKPHPKVRHSSL